MTMTFVLGMVNFQTLHFRIFRAIFSELILENLANMVVVEYVERIGIAVWDYPNVFSEPKVDISWSEYILT